MGKERLEIVWTDPAKNDLKEIFDFLERIISSTFAEKQVIRIINRVDILEDGFTKIGQIEPLLSSKITVYRYLVQDNYKIIYHQSQKTIIIDMVFDTRQYPGKMKIE